MTTDLEKTLVEKMQDEEFIALDEIVAMAMRRLIRCTRSWPKIQTR